MPASIVTGERMKLVDDDHIAQQFRMVDAGGDEYCFDGLRRSEENLWGLLQHSLPRCFADIAMPQSDACADEAGISFDARCDIVQQGLQGTDIENRQTAPLFQSLAGSGGERSQLPSFLRRLEPREIGK